MPANINTSLSKEKTKIKNKASFFYSLIQLLAHNDMLTNTMMMTQKEKLKYLSKEINHYLPLFQSFPEPFKKWIISQHNISSDIKKILNKKPSNLYNKKKKKGGADGPRAGPRAGPIAAPRRRAVAATVGQQLVTAQPVVLPNLDDTEMSRQFQQLGDLNLTHNAMLSRQSQLHMSTTRQQNDIVNMTQIANIHQGVHRNQIQTLNESITELQNELQSIKTDLATVTSESTAFTNKQTEIMETDWKTTIDIATSKWETLGKTTKARVNEFKSKDFKAKSCGLACGGLSGSLIGSMVVQGATSVNTILAIPSAMGTSVTTLGTSFSSWGYGIPFTDDMLLGGLIGGPLKLVGNIFSGATSVFSEPLQTIMTECAPHCGAIVGVSCCLCTSAICITVLQENFGVSDRLQTKDRENNWWLTRQIKDGAQIASWGLVVPLIRDGIAESKSRDYKKAIEALKAYDNNNVKGTKFIQRGDMLRTTNPPSLVNKYKWIQEALENIEEYKNLQKRSERLNSAIERQQNLITRKINEKNTATNEHRQYIARLTRANTLTGTTTTSSGRSRALPAPQPTLRRRRIGPRSGSAGGGYLKKYRKSKHLYINKKKKKK